MNNINIQSFYSTSSKHFQLFLPPFSNISIAGLSAFFTVFFGRILNRSLHASSSEF